ncbi:MAG: GAF domain-containing protein [Gemmatimonadaceae bacterium]
MPPRTLASLAQTLTIAPDLDTAVLALAEALAEIDRVAQLAVIRFDAKRGMLRDRLAPVHGTVDHKTLDTTFDHLPSRERAAVAAGGSFVDFAERSDDVANLFELAPIQDGGWLGLRGMRFEGNLAAILALYEPRKFFGTRAAERFAASAALFELALARVLEHEARGEAVTTLEHVTQRLHGEYERKLAALGAKLAAVSTPGGSGRAGAEIALEQEAAQAREEARRAQRKATALEEQVTAAVEQLEKAHMELHRRSEHLRQKARTLYLFERLLALAATTDDPRQLAEGLISLVGEDMQSRRCSLMLRAPEPSTLFLAAARGLPPGIAEGMRTAVGQGVAGKVASSREPLLVQDVTEAKAHPLLRDEYFNTGSFISFPLVFLDELVGVVNLTNPAMPGGVFTEEDVERVRLLALVIALVATSARLPERLVETLSVY